MRNQATESTNNVNTKRRNVTIIGLLIIMILLIHMIR